MRKLPIVTSGLIMMLALAGCGGTESPEDAQTTSPAQATETIAAPPATPEDSPTAASDGTPSPTEDSSPEPTPTEEQESGSPSQSTTDDPTGTEPTPNGVLSPEVKGQTLVLADFFNPDSDWTEGRYDVADQGSVSGVAREVSTCGLSDWAPTLELRLANNFDNMKFQVGQDNNSNRHSPYESRATASNWTCKPCPSTRSRTSRSRWTVSMPSRSSSTWTNRTRTAPQDRFRP